MNERFSTADIYWKHVDKKKYLEAIKILNSLTPEQQDAVELYGESKYSAGDDDGWEAGHNENSDY